MSARILIFAQSPPPVHGQSVMVGHLLDALHESGQRNLAFAPIDATAHISYFHVNPLLSEDLTDIGRRRPRKLLLVLKYIAEALKAKFRHGLDSLYFVPAPPNRTGMYRDWLVLFFCRPFFRKIVLHLHCIGQPEFVEYKLNAFERALARTFYGGAELSIALSNYSRDEAAYFGSRHTVVVPNGIPDPCPHFDAEIWPQRQRRAVELATGAARFYEVLFIAGRMTEKGLFDALTAIAEANRRLAAKSSSLRMRLTVAGNFEQDERTQFNAVAGDLNTVDGPFIIDAGWADEEKKKQLYRAADCFIFPTTYPAESFGLVLTEAMAHGCAVITTRWQAVPEVLPGGYPHLVDPHDIGAMAGALLACAAAPAERTLRDYFLARFTRERFAERMIQVLGDL